MRIATLAAVLLGLVVAGCGTSKTAAVLGATKEARTCAPGSVLRVGTPQRALAAVVAARRVPAHRSPGGPLLARFGRLNVNGVPTVFGVVAKRVDRRCKATWYRVRLPRKPNGSTGWVRARDVSVAFVHTRIEVDLSRRLVTLFRSGRPVFRAKAAIGSRATPTPTGRFYVDQRLVPSDPGGPFGPGAIGISAFSEVLTGWAQGGPVAIHGTNRPDLIGLPVSNGCIRVANRDLRRLFAATLAGTPVVVHA